MEQNEPNPEFIAQQLRKPAGDFAEKIAEVMDEVNRPLFDLTFDTMELADNESVLEIGFGSGKFFNKFFQQSEELQVYGIDYSEEMIESAKSYNQSAIDSEDLVLKLGNSNDIPFPDQSFDKVYCNMVIYFWDQPEQHLKEIHRVLKPSGKFYTGLRSKDSMLKLPFIEHGFNLYDKSTWSSILEKNGFKVGRVAEKLDDEKEIEEQDMRMKSICIVAEKSNS